SVWTVDGAELGDPASDRIVQLEKTAIAELEHGDRGEGLGDRGPVVDRRVAGLASARSVREAVVVSSDDAPVAHQHRAAAHDSGRLREVVEAAGDRLPGALRL